MRWPTRDRSVQARLRRLAHQWQGARSRLTPTGAPYEWVFSSFDPHPRLTCEVAAPGISTSRRRQAALRRLPPCDPDILAKLTDLDGFEPGAALWLSARGEGLHPTKLYAGIQDAAGGHRWAERWIGAGTLLSAAAHRLRMVGYEPVSGRLEFYYALDRFESWHLPLLLRRCHLPMQAADRLGDAVSLLADQPPDQWPRRVGVSLTADRGAVVALALHLPSAALARDRVLRARLLALAAQQGWGLAAYAAYTEPLVAEHPINPYHNVLTLAIGPTGTLALAIGVAPLISRTSL